MHNELHHKTIAQQIQGIHSKEFSVYELTQHYLDRIKTFDKQLNSFITITSDQALTAAKNIDKKLAKIKSRFSQSPISNFLTGIPIAYKDNFCTRGIKTSCGSKMLDNFIAPYDATVVARLRQANCIMLGKTNMDEFAMGSSNENSYYGAVKNPWNLDKVPGGSSGGSAAAVAARLTPCALGTDTGGSARQPASFCGITGLKPTYGLISRHGMISFASSLDQAGILAQTAADIALVLAAIASYDSNDTTSSPNLSGKSYEECVKNLGLPLNGLKIGLPQECFNESLNQDIAKAIDNAIKVLEKLGAQIKPITLSHFNLSMMAYYAIAPAEASSNLARYDGIRYGYRSNNNAIKNINDLYNYSSSEGFGDEVKRRIILGTYILSAQGQEYYIKAQQIRQLIKNDFIAAFKEIDVVLTPTTPTPAFALRNKNTPSPPFKASFADKYTTPANLAGLPGMSLPIGFINDLPIGMQLIGNYFREAQLLNVAHQYQQSTDWHQKIPPLFL